MFSAGVQCFSFILKSNWSVTALKQLFSLSLQYSASYFIPSASTLLALLSHFNIFFSLFHMIVLQELTCFSATHWIILVDFLLSFSTTVFSCLHGSGVLKFVFFILSPVFSLNILFLVWTPLLLFRPVLLTMCSVGNGHLSRWTSVSPLAWADFLKILQRIISLPMHVCLHTHAPTI